MTSKPVDHRQRVTGSGFVRQVLLIWVLWRIYRVDCQENAALNTIYTFETLYQKIAELQSSEQNTSTTVPFIQLSGTTYTFSTPIEIFKPVSIQSDGNAVIVCSGQHRQAFKVFGPVGTVTFSGLTFQGCHDSALLVQVSRQDDLSHRLDVTGCRFESSESSAFISSTGPVAIQLSGCVFTSVAEGTAADPNNPAVVAAVSVQGATSLSISNSKFETGIRALSVSDSGAVNVNSTSFVGSKAVGSGGAVALQGVQPTITVSSSNFTRNSAYPDEDGSLGHGGALFINASKATVQLRSCSFNENQASMQADGSSGHGGALAVMAAAQLRVEFSSFSENKAAGKDAWGGAVWSTTAQASRVLNTTFTRNVAGGQGGALHATVLNTDTSSKQANRVFGCSFASNRAGPHLRYVGAPKVLFPCLKLRGQACMLLPACTLQYPLSVPCRGEALDAYMKSVGPSTFDNAGGAVILMGGMKDGVQLQILWSTFTDNEATLYGGAVAVG